MMIRKDSRRCLGHPLPGRCRDTGSVRKAMAVAALALGLLLAACVPETGQGAEPTGGVARGNSGNSGQERDESLAESFEDAPHGCVAPTGARIRDIDPEDSPVKPWQKPAGEELVVEFETSKLSARYARLLTDAATIWSESPCLNAVAVPTCTPDANCVEVEEDGSPTRNTDGEMEWKGRGAYMESATITLYTRALARATDNGALATIVHEMGHTLGLDHRLERSDVMNSVTTDNTNPVPDAVDFANLAAIYG